MKLTDHFDAFLKNKVNLSDGRIATLDSRVESVGNFLAGGTDAIAANFRDLIPQGSYAQRTIINPVGASDEFDADVLLDMSQVDDWEPKDYVNNLYSVFRGSGTYRDMVGRKSRCVTLNYAGEFHMDVVPYLERHGERYITNRNANAYELTDPEGFNAWLDEQNRITSGRLVKVIRLLKYVRDFKNNFSVKSVILTILLGERITGSALLADPKHYCDLPTALLNLMIDLNDYLQSNPTMPNIDDPSCPTENFNHRWNQEEYANFRNWISTYTDWAKDAYGETDRDQSYTKWRKLLGDKFGRYPIGTTKASQAHRGRTGVADTEEFIEKKFPVALNAAYCVKLTARTERRKGFRTYDLRNWGNKVAKRRNLRFSITSNNVPAPYEVYWKVRNTGEEAIRDNAIRGQILKDDGTCTRKEPTKYTGNHYVEVYIVKNRVVVARDHHPVFVH